MPADTTTDPGTVPLPATTLTEPARAVVDAPTATIMFPEFPLAATPVDRSIPPDDPTDTALAVATVREPEPELKLPPL